MSFVKRVLSAIKSRFKRFMIRLEGVKVFREDLHYFLKNAGVVSWKIDAKEKERASMVSAYHIIEKGLSMPNRRLGFGQSVMFSLINTCRLFANKYGTDDKQLLAALSTIKEYDNLHKENNYMLDLKLQDEINKILAITDVKPLHQFEYTKEQFFSKTNCPFNEFALSRHSTRHFKGEVPIDDIKKAIELAQCAPSACNEQPTRVHVITDKTLVKEVMEMQQGNRGFGHLVEQVIILTTKYVGCNKYSWRYNPFIDTGIYTMNLLYALHFYKIGAIPLIWLNTKERNDRLRELLSIPEYEVPCVVIGVGNVDDTTVCPVSQRNDIDYILKTH